MPVLKWMAEISHTYGTALGSLYRAVLHTKRVDAGLKLYGKITTTVGNNVNDHSGTTESMPTSFILTGPRETRPPRFNTMKWSQVRNPYSGEKVYIKQIQSEVEVETIDATDIDKIDINPFVLTTYQINDVLRRYPQKWVGQPAQTGIIVVWTILGHRYYSTTTSP